MQVVYDPELDALRIFFSSAPTDEGDEDKPGVVIDHDKQGNVIKPGTLAASKRMENARPVQFAVVS